MVKKITEETDITGAFTLKTSIFHRETERNGNRPILVKGIENGREYDKIEEDERTFFWKAKEYVLWKF